MRTVDERQCNTEITAYSCYSRVLCSHKSSESCHLVDIRMKKSSHRQGGKFLCPDVKSVTSALPDSAVSIPPQDKDHEWHPIHQSVVSTCIAQSSARGSRTSALSVLWLCPAGWPDHRNSDDALSLSDQDG